MPQSRVRPLTAEEQAQFLVKWREQPLPQQQQQQQQAAPTTLDDVLNWARWGMAAGSFVPPVTPVTAAIRAASALGTTALGAYDTYNAAQKGNYGEAAIDAAFTALGAGSLAKLRKAKQAAAAAAAAKGSTGNMIRASNAQVAAAQANQAAPPPSARYTMTVPGQPPPRNPLTGAPGVPPPGVPPPAPPPVAPPVVRPGGWPTQPGGGGGAAAAPLPMTPPAAPTGPGPAIAALQNVLNRTNQVAPGTAAGIEGVAAANLPGVSRAIEAAQQGSTPIRQAASQLTSPEARAAFLQAAEKKVLEKLGPAPKFKFGGRELDVVFESPIERAAYEVAGGLKPRSVNDAKLLEFLSRSGIDEHTARYYGTQVRNRMKELAAKAPADARRLPVSNGGPSVLERAVERLAERERETGMTAAQRAAQAQGEKAARLAKAAADKAALGDLTNLPVMLKSFNGLVKQVNSLVKAKKGVPEEMRTSLADSLRILTEVGEKLPDHKGLPKLLAGGARALTLANLSESAATASVRSAVGKVTKARAAKLAGKAAAPEAAMVENATVAVLTKLGAPAGAVDKLRKVMTKAGKSGKSKKDLNDLGFGMTELLTRLGPTVVGGMLGSEAGQQLAPDGSERDPETWRWAGAAAGALTGYAGSSLIMPRAQLRKVLGNKAVDWNRFSLLSSPLAIGRANMGGVSTVILGAIERMMEGKFAEAARGIKHLTSQSAKMKWVGAAFGNPTDYLDDPTLRASFANRVPMGSGVTSWPSRAIAAGDVLSTNAMMKMGYTAKQAAESNLSGDPKTVWGRAFTHLMGESYKKNVTNPLTGVVSEVVVPPTWDKAEHPFIAAAAGLISPFTKTSVQTVEQALRYSPLGATQWGQRTFEQTRPEAIRKAILGSLGGVYGGKKIAENTSAEFDPMLVAAGGPMALPVFIGQRIARGTERDVPWQTTVQQSIEEIPMLGEQFGVQDMIARAVPSGLRDVARAIDPAWEREKGAATVRDYDRSQQMTPVDRVMESLKTPMAGILHKLPILRESLPERFVGVDAYGQPHYKTDRPMFIPDITMRGTVSGRPEIIMPKVLTQTPIQNPSALPKNDAVAQRLKQLEDQVPALGKTITAPMMPQFPEMENQMRMMGMQPKPIERDLRAATLRAKGVTTQRIMERLDAMPGFAQLPPEQKHLMVREMFNQAAKASGGVTTPAMQGATMMPGMRPQIQNNLQSYIRMMESMGPQMR